MAITMEQIADYLVTPIGTGWGGLDHRPASDQTGLGGKFDFDIEFTPQRTAADAQPEAFRPTSTEALKNQLGLKLVKQTGPVNVFVVDHIEMPLPNSCSASQMAASIWLLHRSYEGHYALRG